MKIETLKTDFLGIGTVKGFKFHQIERNERYAIYEVTDQFENVHYEIFEIKTFKIPDFYKGTKYKFYEHYPSDNDFGKFAFTASNIEQLEKIKNTYFT